MGRIRRSRIALDAIGLQRFSLIVYTTITNPILIVEVLSASTEEEDRGNKWQHYQLIPSLMEYVLVSQTHPRVESYRRLPSGAWEYRDTTEGTMQLLSGATVDMATLYAELPV